MESKKRYILPQIVIVWTQNPLMTDASVPVDTSIHPDGSSQAKSYLYDDDEEEL